jgi:pSer/pThr/pTyr-binding forkhead associated (FHA) protein
MDEVRAQGSGDFQPLRLRLHPGDHIYDLTSPDVMLGRQSDADLRMPQPDVSRQHCRFRFTRDGWQIVDLGSLNGVYVNGARVRKVTLIQPGDHIRICGVEFDVEDSNAVADGPSALKCDVTTTQPHPTISQRAA